MSASELGSMLPNFTLRDSGGDRISLWDFRHRRPLALFFLEQPSAQMLQDLEEGYQRYLQAGAAVLVITSKAPSGRYSFPVLIDGKQDVAGRYLAPVPSVYIVDRYGELRGVLKDFSSEGLDHEEVLEWLVFTESDCPECGVPEW